MPFWRHGGLITCRFGALADLTHHCAGLGICCSCEVYVFALFPQKSFFVLAQVFFTGRQFSGKLFFLDNFGRCLRAPQFSWVFARTPIFVLHRRFSGFFAILASNLESATARSILE